MPCSKRMLKCYAGCLHRRMVEEYRDARDAREELREQGEGLQMEPGEFDVMVPKVLFKDWLQGYGWGDPEEVDEGCDRGS